MWHRKPWLLCLVGLLAGCASSVNVDYDRQADFSRLKTFALLEASQIKTGDPRLDSPLVEQRIRKAIVAQLRARGFVPDERQPDFLVRYDIRVKQEIEGDSSGITIGFGSFSSHSAIGLSYGFPGYEVESYDRAVLVIDMLDAASRRLLWRGSYGERLYDGLTPEKMDATINTTVNEILSHFPPGRKT